MLGVKLYDPLFCDGKNLDLLQEVGVNTVYLGRNALVPAFVDNLKKRGMFCNIVEPVFLLDENDPHQLAVLKDGKPAHDDWVRFACPSDSQRLDQVRERILADIDAFDPNGVSLDFMRFFQFWEMTDPSAKSEDLPESCFCDRCREKMSAFASVSDWRQSVITDTARFLSSDIKVRKPGIKVGIHCVPWKLDMFDGSIRTKIGQNFTELSKIGDYLTPMIYHHMMHLEPSYVRSFMQDMARQDCRHIVPSVQVIQAYREEKMGIREFEEALDLALESPSEGAVLYKWEDLVADPERMEIVRSRFKG